MNVLAFEERGARTRQAFSKELSGLIKWDTRRSNLGKELSSRLLADGQKLLMLHSWPSNSAHLEGDPDGETANCQAGAKW